MSFSILDRGEGRFDLLRGDEPIGRLEGSSIGFGGFAGRATARRAATIAYDALSAWLAKERRAAPTPRSGRSLRERRDGQSHLLTLGEIPIGSLVPHAHDASSSATGFDFELLLPPRLVSTLSAAQVIYRALERHGVLPETELVGALG